MIGINPILAPILRYVDGWTTYWQISKLLLGAQIQRSFPYRRRYIIFDIAFDKDRVLVWAWCIRKSCDNRRTILLIAKCDLGLRFEGWWGSRRKIREIKNSVVSPYWIGCYVINLWLQVRLIKNWGCQKVSLSCTWLRVDFRQGCVIGQQLEPRHFLNLAVKRTCAAPAETRRCCLLTRKALQSRSLESKFLTHLP